MSEPTFANEDWLAKATGGTAWATPTRLQSGESLAPARTYFTTDLGNALAFADFFRERFRYVYDRRIWLVWDQGRWRPDTSGEVKRAAKEIGRELLRQAADKSDLNQQRAAVKWAFESQSDRRIRAMLELASSELEFVVTSGQLDCDPFLLTCANGTLDLRAGELRPHSKEDLTSLGTDVAFDPEAECPRWLRFLDEVFDDDEDLIGFVQRAVGYSLTGITREHALLILHGSGANGKTTFIETLKRVLGDFAQTTPFDSLMRAGHRGIPNDVARLHRARLVVAAESGEGRHLNEALVKNLTGADTVVARFLYGEYFEFRPEFKLWLVTNYRPRIDGDDDAIWRRLRLVPFEVSFKGREDQMIGVTLANELAGVLAWAVRGCLEWQQHGLGLAGAVERATSEYRQDEDVLGAFLANRCEFAGTVRVVDLRESYESYCRQLGEKPLVASVLGRRLADRGIGRGTKYGDSMYKGVRLR